MIYFTQKGVVSMAIYNVPVSKTVNLVLTSGQDSTVNVSVGSIDATKTAEYSDQKVMNIKTAIAPILAYPVAKVVKTEKSEIQEEE